MANVKLKAAQVVDVATAGTSVQLPDVDCKKVTLYAKSGNTTEIFVGMSDVSSTVYGIALAAGESIELEVSNTNQIHIDAATSGEGISLIAY